MTTGNGAPTATDSGEDRYVRDGSRQLRDIEELVAKLRSVTRQLAFPARPMPMSRPADALAHVQAAVRSEAGE
jgi:hypothetical protein